MDERHPLAAPVRGEREARQSVDGRGVRWDAADVDAHDRYAGWGCVRAS
jgi:hypothetical protein